MEKILKQLNTSYWEKKIFWFLIVFLLFSIVAYVYFVNQTVLNIVKREKIENQIMSLNSRIGELEFKYISLKNNISLDYAYSIGFVDVKDVKFASRKLSNQGISLRNK